MNITLKRISLALTGAGLLTIYGCGGGGGNGAAAPGAPATVAVPVTVIDGPIRNATVCLDINNSGTCDVDEPTGRTDGDGKVVLTVAAADAGRFPVLAVVGLDAIDSDTGAVPVPFTMSAPADQVTVVSPLTTLVQQTIASTGASTAEAAASVQAATGLTVSLFEDFTKVAAPTDGNISAATLARLIVVTTQQQYAAIEAMEGTSTVDGDTISRADLDSAIQKKLLERLPALVTAASDPAVLAAGTDAREELLLAAADTLVTDSGLTLASVATVVAINNQAASGTPPASEPLAAGFTLSNLNFTNASNYFTRVFTASMAQNTPDASGNVRFVERRYRSNGGHLAVWGAGSEPARQADLHWNGNAWVGCAINAENVSGLRDAQGNSNFDYCDKLETGKSSRATFSIAGKTMLEVYNQVRAAGYTNLTLADTAALGTATFPTGSSLYYQTNTPLTEAIAYYPGSSNPAGVSTVVSQYSSAVSGGGVASTQASGEACNSTEFKTTNGANSTTLEGMIGAMTGTPCVFGTGSFRYPTNTDPVITSPDASDEAWGNSTVSIGIVGSAPVGTGTAPGFYSGNTKLRMAFKGTGTNPVTYYACKERFNNGSTRNCTVIGTGSYAIATLGDARVMTLNNLPTQASVLNYTRVFVERAGLVYAGYQTKPNVTRTARLNTIGATALLGQLELPVADPATPLHLTAGSYQGAWDFHDAAFPTQPGQTVFIKANGDITCQDGSDLSFFTCSLALDASTGAFTLSDGGTNSGTFDFLAGTANGTYVDGADTGNFVGQRR